MYKALLLLVFSLSISAGAHAQNAQSLLMQEPTLNATQIAFAYGGYLWSVDRTGGAAVRLTSGPQ